MQPAPLLSLAALVLTTAGASAQGQIWVVDDDGGADFVDLQPAIDAATSGDVVLLRDGSYSQFTLAGKGLSILGDVGASVNIAPLTTPITSSITGIPAGERAILRGLHFVPPANDDGNLLLIDGCAGLVWLEDIGTEVPFQLPFGYFLSQAEAVDVVDCADVVFVNADIKGATGAPPGQGLEAGQVGLRTANSNVQMYGSSSTAGYTLVLGGTGQPGMSVDGGTVVMRDSYAGGSAGGEGNPFISTGPGNGGPGLRVTGGAEVWAINCVLQGGPGGSDFLGGSTGNPGPAALVLSGTLNESAASAATLTSTAIVRDDDPVDDDAHFTLATVPFSSVYLLASFGTETVFVPALLEAVAVGLDPIVLSVGSTDAQGDFSMSVGIPSLPPGLHAWNATIQMAVFTPEPALEVSNPTLLTVVDDAY